MTQTMMTSPRNILTSPIAAKTTIAAAVLAAMLCAEKAIADDQIKNEFNPVQTGVTSLGHRSRCPWSVDGRPRCSD